MTTYTILPEGRTVFTDSNNNPISGGSVYFYVPPNTTTPKTTYQDAAGATPNSNPVILDGNGSALIYGSGQYLMVLYDQLGNEIYSALTQDLYALIVNGNNTFTGTNNFTGSATAVTQAAGDTSTAIATDAFVSNAVLTKVTGYGGFLNKFRNPGFDVKQRGASGTVTSGNTNYTVDGWQILSAGATTSWAVGYAQLNNANYGNVLTITGNTGITNIELIQRIESYVGASLVGKPTTIQYTIYNDAASTLGPVLYVNYANSQDNFSSVTSDLATVSLQSVVQGAEITVSYTYVPSAGAANGMEVHLKFGGSLNTNSQSVYIILPDIRATPGVATGINNLPPTPEIRPIFAEMTFNQRYLNSTFGNGVLPAQNFTYVGALQAQPYGASAGELYTYWQFPTQMRTAPSITTYSPAAATANWYDKTGSSAIAVSVDPDSAINSTGVLIGSQTTSLTAGHRCYIHAVASSEL